MKRSTTYRGEPKAGQTLVFVLMVILFLTLIAIWQFDVHKILFVKQVSRNAGDAAATAAARWQGLSLNLIGELNVLQAVEISEALARGETNFPAAEAIADLQSRLNYVGPLTGFLAAQQAAKNNGIYVNESFTDLLRDHAGEVRTEYPVRYPDPPWNNAAGEPGAWQQYADMLKAIASEGVAADAENRRFYSDYENRSHLLLNPSFYDAIASKDWCWFYFNARSELYGYSAYTDWPDLPLIDEPEPMNSEYFGLFLRRAPTLAQVPVPDGEDPADLLLSLLEGAPGDSLDTRIVDVETQWMLYRPGDWSAWSDFIGEGFPWDRDIRSEYNVRGADAAVRIETEADRLTPGADASGVQWTAAAKPFGALEDETPASAYGLVLPGFTDVRLIPVDASSAPAVGSRPGWAEFIYDDLPLYMMGGPGALPSGWYQNQLAKWESSAFRQQGIDWLAENSNLCQQPGPGPGGGGGTRRGH